MDRPSAAEPNRRTTVQALTDVVPPSGWTDNDWIAIGTITAAVGTAGALFTALFQIKRERDYRRNLEKGEQTERYRAQARLISAIPGPVKRPSTTYRHGRTGVDLLNVAEEPVFRVVVGVVLIQGTGPQTLEEMLEFAAHRQDGLRPATTLSLLPSGRYRVWILGGGWSGVLSGRSGAEIAFTDRGGAHWIRRASGQLQELPEDAITYFEKHGLHGPHDFQRPLRFLH